MTAAPTPARHDRAAGFLRGWVLPALIFAVLYMVLSGRFAPSTGLIEAGTHLPDAPVVNMSTGAHTTLSALAKHGPVALHVFATWCAVCMREWPHLARLAKAHAREATVIPIGLDDPAAVRMLLHQKPLPFPVYLGGGEVEHALRVKSFPYTVFVAAGPTVLYDQVGALQARSFAVARARYDASLSEPSK